MPVILRAARIAFLFAAVAAGACAAGCGGAARGDTKSFRLPSPSMVPTFKVGAIVTADLGAYKRHPPRRGDIVILYPPSGAASFACGVPSEPADGRPCERPTILEDRTVKFIHRVTGLPGDWLYVQNNRTYIGRARAGRYVQQKEPFIARNTPCDELCNLRKPIHIPADHYFVMGDNRGEAYDSRAWGPAPRSSVLAKVLGD
jgi:signal peptidase I